jgi:hypothetical protein
MKAAKEKTFLLVFVVLTMFTCAPSFASATELEISKTRAELKSNLAENRVSESLFYAVKRDRNYDRLEEVASESSVAPNTGASFKTWNQFQSGTAGQFASRAEASAAWNAYKQANGIVTGAVRSTAAKSNFLKGLADDVNTPSWMKPWLKQGKNPPGYDVDHILPLSVGGLDDAANMRLQLRELHKLHHRFYRPWE